ncbi:hypothetical protein K0M31_013009, partial [Melipona bicolor]
RAAESKGGEGKGGGGNSGIPLGEKRRSEVLERRHLPISEDDLAARVSRAIVFASWPAPAPRRLCRLRAYR